MYMTNDDNLCTNPEKIRYESEAQAVAYGKLLRELRGARRMRAYWCPGGHWHLATKWRKHGKARLSGAKRQKRQRLIAEGVWESEGGALRDL